MSRSKTSASFRALSLDLFDTLVDLRWDGGSGRRTSTSLLHDAIARHVGFSLEEFTTLLTEVDRELRVPRYADGIEVPTLERFTRLTERLGIAAPELPERLTEIHMGVIRSHVAVPGHHRELLQSLRRCVRVGLCSNFSHAPTAYRILAEFELEPHFDAVVISEEIGLRKPRREMFEAVLTGLSAEPEDTLHVGDSLRDDVAGAAALGMRTAWITRCVSDPEGALADYEGPRPDWVVGDLDQLPAVLERRN